MKKTIMYLILILTFSNVNVFASSVDYFSPNRESVEQNEQNFSLRLEIMNNVMKRRLEDYLPTGNTNIDFLSQMLELNSSEALISAAIQSYTKNPLIITLANEIVSDESGEINEMRLLRKELLKNYKLGSQSNEAYIKEYKSITDIMLRKLIDYKSTGDDEVDYLNNLLILNNGSIDLSKAALKYINDDTTKKIAENSIKTKTENNAKIESIIKEIIEILKKSS